MWQGEDDEAFAFDVRNLEKIQINARIVIRNLGVGFR